MTLINLGTDPYVYMLVDMLFGTILGILVLVYDLKVNKLTPQIVWRKRDGIY